MTSSTMSRLRPVRLRCRPFGLGNLWHMTLRNPRVPWEAKPESRPGHSTEQRRLGGRQFSRKPPPAVARVVVEPMLQ